MHKSGFQYQFSAHPSALDVDTRVLLAHDCLLETTESVDQAINQGMHVTERTGWKQGPAGGAVMLSMRVPLKRVCTSGALAVIAVADSML